jgi:hypothetical protein
LSGDLGEHCLSGALDAKSNIPTYSRRELRSPRQYSEKVGTAPLLRGAYLPNEIGFAFLCLLSLAKQRK